MAICFCCKKELITTEKTGVFICNPCWDKDPKTCEAFFAQLQKKAQEEWAEELARRIAQGQIEIDASRGFIRGTLGSIGGSM